jgi:uncharacterized protein (DUF885 family)
VDRGEEGSLQWERRISIVPLPEELAPKETLPGRELPKLFAELPRLPYGIRAMDVTEGDNADHYSSGALDGSRAGYYYVNLYKPETRPK